MTGERDLQGRTALVTGASRGIGARVAERLAGAGARVWLLARSPAALAEVAARIGGEALVADVADAASLEGALARLRHDAGGPPDIVVNAAGVFAIAPIGRATPESLEEHLAVNLRGAFLVVHALLPAMLERRGGLIVNVGSVAGRKAFAGNAAYSASKFGLRGFHEVLVEELRGTGVRATLLEPSATDTSLWDPVDTEADPTVPSRGSMLAPDDVAEAVLFVATRPDHVRIPLLQIERA